MLSLVHYSETFLNKSWDWLNDEEIKALTLTGNFTKEQQRQWYNSLSVRQDYKVWGIQYGEEAIGACGLKHITSFDAEYWGYIGEKNFWSKGLGSEILKQVFKQSKNLNLKQLFLHVGEENHRAIRLYKKEGFINNGFSDKVGVIRMNKNL